MNILKVEHIAFAVKDLKKAISFYENILGLACYTIEDVHDQKIRTAVIRVGETKIELMEATDPQSTVAAFIAKRGEGMHHIAFAVDGLDDNLKELDTNGIRLIDKQKRKGAEGLNIAFAHPSSCFGALLEFCEED